MRRETLCIAAMLGSACLEPLASDVPGYSRHLLAADARVPSSDHDFELNQRIQQSDGLSAGGVPVLTGFAAGREIRYRDFGETKALVSPAYVLMRCDERHEPLANGMLDHPLLWDSAPGDADYTPLRALYPVCVTGRYGGELITSVEALSDAVEMGLVREPQAPTRWLDLPVIASDVASSSLDEAAFYRGVRVRYLALDELSAGLPYADKRIKASNVYELARTSSPGHVERVVFAQARASAEGEPNPRYAPAWNLVAVTLSEDAPLDAFTKESDLVNVAEDGALSPASPFVLTAEPAQISVNRPHEREATP